MEGRAVRQSFEMRPPKNHPNKFGLNWFSGFREDENVKVYD
jgi:hypothetical protein